MKRQKKSPKIKKESTNKETKNKKKRPKKKCDVSEREREALY